MKTLRIFMLLMQAVLYGYAQGQVPSTDEARLGFNKLLSYKVEVTFNKTTHLIFPSAIRYVDLGSEFVIAGKAEDAENVLRVKAAVIDFKPETNFSVITEDGQFYNFDVSYSADPGARNYDLSKMGAAAKAGNEVLFDELGKNSPQFAAVLMARILERNRRLINHIGSRSYGVLFVLKSIHIHDGKFYFLTELRNNSNLPFKLDFIKFKVTDRKLVRRTVVQETTLTPLRSYKPLDEVPGKSAATGVYLLDQFTMGTDKVLRIEIFEKNGGRHQVLRVDNADLVRAAVIKNLK